MDTYLPSKRRRIVTTCTECHRRKQRCNRAEPCNVCVARNVPGRCFYGKDTADQNVKVQREEKLHRELNGQAEETKIGLQSHPVELPDQIGYSSKYDSNAFIGLQKSLQDLGDQTAEKAPSSSSYLPGTNEKFRSLVSQLPVAGVANKLIDIFFSEANWYFLVLERCYFDILRRSWFDLSPNMGILVEDLPEELRYFPALLFQVLAVALQFLPPNSSSSKILDLETASTYDQLSQDFSLAGMALMGLLGRHNSAITAVQHDLMRALWLKNCSRGTESWYSLGDAIRHAQDLGLHLQSATVQSAVGDVEETLARLWYDEYKKRLWATLFIWDSHMALILGQPRTINANDCTASSPMDCDFPRHVRKTVPTGTNPNGLPSSYSSHVFHYHLAHKVHDMLSKGANKRHLKDYSIVQDLHNQVVSLLNDLSPPVRPENPDVSWDLQCQHLPKQRQHISSAANSFLMALHRPHVAVHTKSRHAAIQAALDCLEAQQRLFELVGESHYKIYTLSFYTIDAGIFLSATILEHPPVDQVVLEQIQSALRKAISRLTLMSDRSAMAGTGLRLLTSCYNKISSLHIDKSVTNYIELAAHDPGHAGNMQRYSMTGFPEEDELDQAMSISGFPSLLDVSTGDTNHLSMHPGGLQSPRYGVLASAGDTTESLSTWTRQMEQLVDLDPCAPINESAWSSLLG
jgi:Fungal specific transcription factor domain